MIDKESKENIQYEKQSKPVTPKGVNVSKKNSFKSRMKNSCNQEGLEFNKVNSFLVYSGKSKVLDSDTIMKGEVKITKPPRRHLRKF